jgi:hypothetical protein
VGIAALLDKAGPTLATGVILALLGAAATSALAWRDLLSTSAVRFGYVTAEIERLRVDFDNFRRPSDRFTRADGDALQRRVDELERRVREQEMRAPRLTPALEKVQDDCESLKEIAITCREKIRHVEAEQEQNRLCQRVQACRK